MAVISCVMPVYNGAKYLRAAIESVLAQSFADWELLLVDDCSTDESRAIMESFCDPRIRVLHNEVNQRLPRSLNIGFRAAGGKYWTWTSDDNLYRPEAFARMAQALEDESDCALVYGDMEYIDAQGKPCGVQQSAPERIWTENVVGACFLYRREAAERVGEYDAGRFLVEDYDYWLRMAARYKIRRLPEILYAYRRHAGSLTQRREAEIERQLYRLQVSHLNALLANVKGDEKEILFTEMALASGADVKALAECFFAGDMPERLRWLDFLSDGEEVPNSREGHFILCGAGEEGKKLLRRLGKERVDFFADHNPERIGTRFCGVPVIAFSRIRQERKEQTIVIATAPRTAGEIARELVQRGLAPFVYGRSLCRQDEREKGTDTLL